MSELTGMMNIGREMAGKLESVGIGSAEELQEIGAKQAFFPTPIRRRGSLTPAPSAASSPCRVSLSIRLP